MNEIESPGSSIRVYVKRQNVTIVSSTSSWGEYSCAQPLTSSPDKSGKSRTIFPTEQQIVLDAAMRAADQMGFSLEIIDMRDLGLLKRLRKEHSISIPRIEFMDAVLEGTPTTKEIMEFISQTLQECEDHSQNISGKE